MIDTSKIAPLIRNAIDIAVDLPVAGEFTDKDVMRLVQRKVILHNISKLLFGNSTYHDYVKDHLIIPQYVYIEDSYIQKSISDNPQGLRFSSKAPYFFISETETTNNSYRLIIPMIPDNIENALFGILTTAEPGMLLNWTEYGYIVTSKHSKKESKWVMKFSQSRDDIKMNDQDKFWLMQLEDSARLTMIVYNQERVKHVFGGVFPKELLALRAWCNMLVQAINHNRFDGSTIEVLPEWDDFDTFMEWSNSNGLNINTMFLRKDRTKGYHPSNCEWISEKDAHIKYDLQAFFSHFTPERYYTFADKNKYYSLSKLMNYEIAVNDTIKPVMDWEFETGIPMFLILWRKYRGLKNEELFMPYSDQSPVVYTNKEIEINGVVKTAKEWAEESGISLKTIISRVRYGWKDEELLIPPKGAGYRVR